MTTEEYYKRNISIGTQLMRLSDNKIFSVCQIRDVSEFGNPQRLYILKAPNGVEFPHDAHSIDCFYCLGITNCEVKK